MDVWAFLDVLSGNSGICYSVLLPAFEHGLVGFTKNSL